MIRMVTALLLMFALAAGCQTMGKEPVSVAPAAPSDLLSDAKELFRKEKYPDALAALERALRQEKSTAHEPDIKYLIAEIHAAPENPQRDYSQALAEFDEFIHLYPNHERTGDARVWKQALKTIAELKRENERLRKNIEGLKQLDVKQEQKRLGK